MGICYYVANTRKKQYFDPGWFGECTKRGGILNGIGGHTLAQLLLPDNALDFYLTTWIGDPLVLVGDDDPKPIELLLPHADNPRDEPYDILRRHFDNITLNLMAYMAKYILSPRTFAERVKTDTGMFQDLVHAAVYLPAPHIEDELVRQFGENWREKYAKESRSEALHRVLPWTPALDYLPRPRSICVGQFVLDHRPRRPPM